MKSSLWGFFPHILCFWCCMQNSLPNPRSLIFSPMFPSRSFIVLHFILSYIIHAELTFRKSGESVKFIVYSIFCIYTSNLSNIICWKDYPLSIELPLFFCQRSPDDICWSLFLCSLFHSIDLCLLFCQYHAILITVTL